MDQLPVEINIDHSWNSQIHALLIFSLYFTNPASYYISAGMVRSFSHGDVSLMFYEIPSLPFQDIEKPKRRKRTDGRTTWKQYTPHKHSLRGV